MARLENIGIGLVSIGSVTVNINNMSIGLPRFGSRPAQTRFQNDSFDQRGRERSLIVR